MDGSSRKTLLNNTELIFWPNGLTIDYQTDLLYWIDGKLNLVGCMDLKGGTVFSWEMATKYFIVSFERDSKTTYRSLLQKFYIVTYLD